jgi:hypothetical protein
MSRPSSGRLDGNTGTQGGGIVVGGAEGAGASLTVTNTMITGNEAVSLNTGAAIHATNAQVTIASSTIDANKNTALGAGGLYVYRGGGTVTDTVLAGNTGAYPDCEGIVTPLSSGGHNVIGVESTGSARCSAFANGAHADRVGSEATPLNPRLAPLAESGGPAPTQALEAESPAVDAADVVACESAPVSNLDERGVSRHAVGRGTCDAGAWDSGAPVKTLYVSAKATSAPTCAEASSSRPFETIEGALACAGDGTLIKLGAGRFAGGLTVSRSVTLQGVASAGKTVIASPGATPQSLTEITDAPGVDVTLEDLTAARRRRLDGLADPARRDRGERRRLHLRRQRGRCLIAVPDRRRLADAARQHAREQRRA